MTDKAKIGVIIGRFQTPYLHAGHKAIIDHVISKNDTVVILVGDRASPATETNPMDFDTRRYMIREYLANVNMAGINRNEKMIAVAKIMDCETNEEWVRNVDRLIGAFEVGFGATLYCGRDGFAPHYINHGGKYKVEIVSFGNDDITATSIRESCGKLGSMNEDNRIGIVKAMQNMWPRHYLTVDMALLSPDDSSIVVAKKKFDKAYRFPGGFVEMNEPLVIAAGREMYEETKLISEHSWKLVKEFIIPDWRIRDTKKVTHRTYLMVGKAMVYTRPTASDDVSMAEWKKLTELKPEDFIPNHQALFAELLNYINVRKQS